LYKILQKCANANSLIKTYSHFCIGFFEFHEPNKPLPKQKYYRSGVYLSQVISGKIEEENTENEEGNEQSESGFESAVPQPMQQIETEMEQAKKLLLATFTFIPLVHNRKLCIQCRQGRNGQKTIEISIKNVGIKNGNFCQ
jgi:hypothetical protein